MSTIEIVICLLLLFMVVPDGCRRLGRPGLTYSAFVVFGVGLGTMLDSKVSETLIQAGKVGFLLLLFEVGLEIDLPRFREFLRPLRFAGLWSLAQYPVAILLGMTAGLNMGEALLGASALAACSVGMAHAGWKHYDGLHGESKVFVLQVMVGLELLAIVVLAVEMAAIEKGLSWAIGLKLLGMASVIWLVSRFAERFVQVFQKILEKATHWRVHLVVLVILLICAAGERLGLSAAKTAFFLGLFMSRARHAGMNLEEHIAPISTKFLIPVFFVALGLQLHWKTLFGLTAVTALGAAFLLLGVREVLHRRWLKTGGSQESYLLLCPNLTLVALAASVLLERSETAQGATWLLLTGLFITIPSVLMLPVSKLRGGVQSPAAGPSAAPKVIPIANE